MTLSITETVVEKSFEEQKENMYFLKVKFI